MSKILVGTGGRSETDLKIDSGEPLLAQKTDSFMAFWHVGNINCQHMLRLGFVWHG